MEVESDSLLILVEGIRQLNEAWDKLRGKEPRQRLQPPAGKAQISQLQKALAIILPDDYVAMLRMHNGWENFRADYSLLSIEQMMGEGSLVKRIAQLKHTLEESQETAGHKPIIFLAGLYGWYCVYFDLSSHKPSGSMDVVQWDLGGVIRPHPGFTAYLQAHKSVLEKVVEKERKRLRS